MQMNWKVRFRNKVWLSSFFAAILTFVYTILGLFDVAPHVTQNQVSEFIKALLMFLSIMGVIVDPTTAGISDSDRAMTYVRPFNKNIESDEESDAAEDGILGGKDDPGEEG